MLGVASLLAACSPASDTPTPSGTSDLAGQTITVLVSGGHRQFDPIWNGELQKWEAQTGITVNLQKVDTVNILPTFLRDSQLGQCTFDNVEMLDGGTAAAAPYMADLGEFLTADGSSVDQLASTQVGWATKAMTFDGKLKFYPFYSGAKAVAYRKDLFEDPANQAAFQTEFGYALPEPPTTMQQVADLAKFFTKDGNYGIVFSGSGDPGGTTLSDLSFRNGVGGFQDDNGNALFGPAHPDNAAKVTQAAQWLSDLIKNGYAPSTLTAMQTTDTASLFTSGKVAMDYDHIYLSWSALNDPSSAVAGKVGSFEIPSFVQGQGGIPFYWGRGIPECSQHKAASWAFTKWIMSPDIQKLALSKGTGVYVPTDTDLLAWATSQNIIPQGVADAVTHAQYYKITPVTNSIRNDIGIPEAEKLFGGADPTSLVTDFGNQVQQAAVDAGLASN